MEKQTLDLASWAFWNRSPGAGSRLTFRAAFIQTWYYRILRMVQMVREGSETGWLPNSRDFMGEFGVSRRPETWISYVTRSAPRWSTRGPSGDPAPKGEVLMACEAIVQSCLIFEQGKLRAVDITTRLRGFPIVFSNACETGVAIPSESVGPGWAGLAVAFVALGAVNYIGTL